MSLWLPPWVCAGCSTSPAWPRSPGEDRVATWETAPTGVERELKSTSGLRLACGRRQSGGMVQPGVSRGWDLRGPPPFFCGGRCVFEFTPRIDPSVACYRSGVFALVEKKNPSIKRMQVRSLHHSLDQQCRSSAALTGLLARSAWAVRDMWSSRLLWTLASSRLKSYSSRQQLARSLLLQALGSRRW